MSENRKVVVIVTPEFFHNEDLNLFAARIRPLGLTGYGENTDVASAKVKRMFASWVRGRRLVGDLEVRLNASGLEWHWFDEYDGDLPVEMIHSLPTPSESEAADKTHASTDWRHTPREVGMAA